MNNKEEAVIQLDLPRQILNQKYYVGIIIVRYENPKGMISSSNLIKINSIKSQKLMDVTKGYKKLYKLLKAGIKPILHHLDNEESRKLIKVFKKNKI